MYFEELALKEQVAELEDLYAECLVDNADKQHLEGIWLLIRELKMQLTQAQNFISTPSWTAQAGVARN